MLETLGKSGIMPHGTCLLWREDLLFLHVAGDSLTFLAYAAIPIGLIYLVKKREDMRFNWIFVMFAAFILLCGITHLMGLINIWHNYYYLSGFAKVATGIVSMITAVMLWKLIPKAVAIPTKSALEQRNRELIQAQRELEEANQSLEARVEERTRELAYLAVTDPLTELYNRGEILRRTQDELNRSERYGNTLSILMLDIDLFKDINDRHGHVAGDKVLKQVAQALTNNCRTPDRVGRYGGEEFLVMCPETDAEAACQLAQRMCSAIRELDIPSIPVTCSIGTATCQAGQSLEDLITSADKALYVAKGRGRDQVVCS